MRHTRSSQLFGISARCPTFGEFTAASVLACGLWLATCGLMFRLDALPDRFNAGALLLMLEWTCVSIRIGIRPQLGGRHVLVNLAGCAALLGAYGSVFEMLG
jgi:hypothetical protein